VNTTAAARKSFFLVEDEALIRMMLVDMIEELGHEVVVEAGSLAEALPLARDAAFDVAILDINLGGGLNSAPIAEVLAKREIPFIYASGYGADGVPDGFKARPVLRKPFQLDELDQRIRALPSNG
jgi:CheY-like chemotaxis protein